MKRIAAPDEPPCLAAWREDNPGATWDQFRTAHRDLPDGTRGCAREVLEVLLVAQHHLCAFCELDLERQLWSQVEHWHPKSHARSLAQLGTRLQQFHGRLRGRGTR